MEESEKYGASLCFQRGRVMTTCQLNNSIPLRHPSHLIPQHKTLTFSSWRFQQRSHELHSMYKVMPWKPRCSGHLGSWHPWHHLDLGTSAGWCAWLTPTPSGVAQWVPPRDGPMPKSEFTTWTHRLQETSGESMWPWHPFVSVLPHHWRNPGDQNLEWPRLPKQTSLHFQLWRVVVQGCMGEWRKYSYIVKHCRQHDECRTSWILTSCRFTAIASVRKFCGHKLRLVLGGFAPSIDQSSWPAGVQPWQELKPLSAASSSIPRASTSSCIIRTVLTLRKQRIPFRWIINQLRH